MHGFFLTKSVDEIAEVVSEMRPDLSASSSPDGTVTIAFTGIEDSLRLNAVLGDKRWLEVLHAHNDVMGARWESIRQSLRPSKTRAHLFGFGSVCT